VISNSPFILNLDCDHYINNSQALRTGICFMLGRDSDTVAFVQFPQRFEGVDPTDLYANHNRIFFDGTLRALDGMQGPIYVGTGCMFRRITLYGFDPPRINVGWSSPPRPPWRKASTASCPYRRSRTASRTRSWTPSRERPTRRRSWT